MLSKVNPTGWADDIDIPTAAQLNALDAQHAQAVDGVGGGVYTLVASLEFAGAGVGINPLLDTTQTGIATRHALGHFPERISRNKWANANFNGAAHKVADTSADTYWFNGAMTQAWNIDLATATGQLPVDNDVIAIAIAAATGWVVNIWQEGGVQIGVLKAAYAFQNAGTPIVARFFWDGTASLWRPFEMTGDAAL